MSPKIHRQTETMPAYNHTKRNVVEKTSNHCTLNQEGDFHCHECGYKYLGRTSLQVQNHFEEEHGFVFGHLVWTWLCDRLECEPVRNHVIAEGMLGSG